MEPATVLLSANNMWRARPDIVLVTPQRNVDDSLAVSGASNDTWDEAKTVLVPQLP